MILFNSDNRFSFFLSSCATARVVVFCPCGFFLRELRGLHVVVVVHGVVVVGVLAGGGGGAGDPGLLVQDGAADGLKKLEKIRIVV